MFNPIAIVFNINLGGMGGLGATLASLLDNCSDPARLRLYFMCSRLSDSHKENIRTLLGRQSFAGETFFLDYDADIEFADFPALLGDRTTYGRLLIPGLLTEDQVVYLDSDLVINTDIIPMAESDLRGYLLGGITRATITYALDNQFFRDKGYSVDLPYFNAGVLVLNLRKWRDENIDAQWRTLLNERNSDLTSHDQTILNYICAGEFEQLPILYNIPWYSFKPAPDELNGILHFVGSPKPWDLFGRLWHPGYSIWKKYNPDNWSGIYQKMDVARLQRFYSIRRSILRGIKKKYT